MDVEEQLVAENERERNAISATAAPPPTASATEQTANVVERETENDTAASSDATQEFAPAAVEEEIFQSLESEEMHDALSLPSNDETEQLGAAAVVQVEMHNAESAHEETEQPQQENENLVADPDNAIVRRSESPEYDASLFPHLEDVEMPENELLAEGGAEGNLLMDDTDSTSSDFVYDEDVEPADGSRRWVIQAARVHSAIRELVDQNRRREGGIASLLDRNNLMQNIRRVVYSLEHNRARNRANGNEGDQGMEADDENEAETDGTETESNVESEEQDNTISFDTNLPAEHSYLGTNMNRVSGVNYLDVGQRFHMMIFMHQHILFPDEVLPFMISSLVMEADIDSQNGCLFGVCFPFLRENEQDDIMYGVTCQIYEKGTDSRGNMLIKSRALQRFVTKNSELTGPLQYIAGDPQLKCYGYVKVLPEIYLPEPLKCIQMGSMSRFRDSGSMRHIYRRFQAATTPWPTHIYDYYCIEAIINKARMQLAQHKIDTMPVDPVQLSFWLVRNLHLPESLMKKIFISDSVNIRLKLISTTLTEESIYICRYCGNKIAHSKELFAMSKHGVQTQYCNSAGYIHETNTVYHLLRNAISYSGAPSSEFSWFPGYQWHIIVCKSCSRHIGWEFKALEPNLVPKSFFGISSSSVRLTVPVEVPRDPRAVIYRSLMRLARRQMQ